MTLDPAHAAHLAGRARWPGIDVDLPTFSAFVHARVEAGQDPADAIPALSITDLYLVCGCLAGSADVLNGFTRAADR